MTKTAIVAGGGIAGTVAAIALHRAGFTPLVHEAYPADADERGAFLTVAVNGLAALRALGLDPAELLAAGYPTPRLVLEQRRRPPAGRAAARRPDRGRHRRPRRSAAPTSTPRCAPRRSAAASRSSTASAWSRSPRTPSGVTAGVRRRHHRSRADLLVGADGLHSRTRRLARPGGARAALPRPAQRRRLHHRPGRRRAGPRRPAWCTWPSASGASSAGAWRRTARCGGSPTRRRKQPARPRLRRRTQWRAHLLDLFADDADPGGRDHPGHRRGARAVEHLRPAPGAGLAAGPDGADRRRRARRLAVLRAGRLDGHRGRRDAGPVPRRARRTSRPRWPTTSGCAASGCEKVVASGRRNGSGKTAGPVGSAHPGRDDAAGDADALPQGRPAGLDPRPPGLSCLKPRCAAGTRTQLAIGPPGSSGDGPERRERRLRPEVVGLGHGPVQPRRLAPGRRPRRRRRGS